MGRLVPFLLVFAAGALAGYLLAPRGDTPREVHPAREPVIPPGQGHPGPSAEAARAEAVPGGAQLHGRPGGPTPREAAAPPPVRRRVAPDGRVAVVVRLVSPDGTAPGEGTIYWATDRNTPTRSMHRLRWTAPQTTAWIEPGDTWILATGGRHDAFKSEASHLRVSSRGPPQEVVLVLQDRPGIHGRVVLPDAFEKPRLIVRLRTLAGASPPSKPAFERSDPFFRPRADDGFAFVFHDLAPGGYLLGLSLGYDDFPLVESVWVADCMIEKDLVLESFDPGRYMEVRVLGPDGSPLRDAQVSISFSEGRLSVAGGNVMLRRTDGVFIVDHIPEQTLQQDGTYKEGVFTVHVRTRAHGEIVRPYDPTTTRALTIRVAELDTLAVRLTDYEGSTAEGLLRVGFRSVGETGVRNPEAVEPNGSVAFGRVQPGAYEIVLLAGRPKPSLVAVHRVDVQPGAGAVELPTPVLHRLVIRVPDGAVDPTFTLRRAFGEEQWSYGWAADGEPGELRFDYLTDGTYTLEGHVGERWVKREVDIPAESVLRLD